jgi:hypothetical protein
MLRMIDGTSRMEDKERLIEQFSLMEKPEMISNYEEVLIPYNRDLS